MRLKHYRRNWRRYWWQFWRPKKPPKDKAKRMIKYRSVLSPIVWKK